MEQLYKLSVRCYFPGAGNWVNHYPEIALKDLKKWVEAYKFTHPNCEAITVKIWLHDEKEEN